MVATQLVGSLYEALPPQTVIAGVIIEFVSTAVGVCRAPLGTALIAVGIALQIVTRIKRSYHCRRRQRRLHRLTPDVIDNINQGLKAD